MTRKKGIVAIIGRPNVGKSTLFNRIFGKRLSIVENSAGVTRDRLYANCEWLNRPFILIDTGGITIKDAPFQKEIRVQVDIALEQADVVVFVCSGQEGLTQEDEYITKLLYKTPKPIILAINKIDNKEKAIIIDDFWSLGLGIPYPISSTHGIGTGDLLDEIIMQLPNVNENNLKDVIAFSIVGKVNVGKSSLTNAILNEERTIVSDVRGTTRDAIDTPFKREKRNYVVIDTAGIRKSGKIYEKIEKYSILRTIRAVDRSQIVLLVIDASLSITDQDLNIGGMIKDSGKGVIIIVNKWDIRYNLNQTMDKYKKMIYAFYKFLTFAPVIFTSALNKTRIHTIFNSLSLVNKAMYKHIQTSILNEIINNAVLLNGPSRHNNGILNIFYASQIKTNPPTIVFFVNDKSFLHFSYKRYLENQIRNSFGFQGTPLTLLFRKRT